MTHLGLDISNYQGSLTAAQAQGLRQAGIEFCYVLLTDGISFKNPLAAEQSAALRGAGIHVGFFHFLRPVSTNADQILDFITMAHACGGTTLPLALDSETADANGWADLASRMASFARQIAAVQTDVTNPHALIYCNGNFANSLPGVPWGNWLWFADPSNTQPNRPRLITQKAPRPVASLPSVDFDEFGGTDAQWQAFIGSQAPPAPSPGPVPNPLGLPLVPGFNLAPGIPEVAVIGTMQGGGVFTGHNVVPGTTVYAGIGSPTQWHAGADLKTLPAGTPLAVATADLSKVQAPVVAEQL